MAHESATIEIGDQRVRERMAARVGRPVEAITYVSPSGNATSGWAGGLIGAMSPGGLATDMMIGIASGEVLRRSRARANDMPPNMMLVVTEHDIHLYGTKMLNAVVGEHLATVPYGAIQDVRVSGRVSAVLLKIRLADGTDLCIEGNRGFGSKAGEVFRHLAARANSVAVGTAPPPVAQAEAEVAGALESVTGLMAKGAAAFGEQVKAARTASSSAASSMTAGVTAELERLADLRDRGVLTEAEFVQQKSRVLGTA